jgi:hypothetical protein
MTLRRTIYLVLAAMLLTNSTGLTAHAQQLSSTQGGSRQAVGLSDSQVFRIQALLLTQTTEIRSLRLNVQSAQETLNAAVATGDPVLTATALLSLDAAEKALKNTELANQRNLMSLLNESQKRLIEDHSSKSVPASD